MARQRMINVSIANDIKLARLTSQAELMYLKTIPHLDRDGLITGSPLDLLGIISPLRFSELFDIMPDIVSSWADVGLVAPYDSPGGPVLHFVGFQKNQTLKHYSRERPSNYPPPPGLERSENGLTEAIPTEIPDIIPKIPDIPVQVEENRIESAADDNDVPSGSPIPAEKHQIYQKLAAYGIEPPALTQIASNGITLEQVDAWLAYMPHYEGPRPQGYLINRLRDHDTAPPIPQPEPEPEYIDTTTSQQPEPEPGTPAHTWNQAKRELRLQITADTYEMYLHPTTVLSQDGHTWIIGTPNHFVTDWLTVRLNRVIQRTLSHITNDPEITITYQEQTP